MTADKLFNLAFGALIAQRREKQKLTQSALAKLVGSTQCTVARIEAGTSTPSINQLFRYTEVLKVIPHVLFKAAQDAVTLTREVISRANAVAPRGFAPLEPADIISVIARKMIMP